MTEKRKLGKITRDDSGRVMKVEGFGEEAILIPFIDDIARSIEEFDESTQKYANRMEILTVAMLILAATQVLLAMVFFVS